MKDKEELNFLHLASTVKALSVSYFWSLENYPSSCESCVLQFSLLGLHYFSETQKTGRPSPYPISMVLEWSKPSLLKGVIMLR